jgi:hypothetical protein
MLKSTTKTDNALMSYRILENGCKVDRKNWKEKMNTHRFAFKNIAALLILILVSVGLEGCCSIQSVAKEPQKNENTLQEPTVSVIVLEEMEELAESDPSEVEIEPSPTSENLVYTNDTYGFRFDYSASWTLTEKNHGIILKKGSNRLVVKFRWVEEDVNLGPGGVGAGEFTYSDKIRFLGEIIPVDELIYECETKGVFYGKTGFEIGNLVFLIILDDFETGYLNVNLSEDIIAEAKTILESFSWITAETDTIDLDQNVEQQDEVDYSHFWVTLEDPYYIVQFAVPCFWHVDFPDIYHNESQGYPIKNYTEEFARSFGKKTDGAFQNGGIKIDMMFDSGKIYGIPPGVSLQEYITMEVNANPGVNLISTEEITINNQDSLLVTTETTFGIAQYYLMNINDHIYLKFVPYPNPEALHNPDVQAVLHSIAFQPDIQVNLPQIMPGNPPDGLDAPCLDQINEVGCVPVGLPQISKQDATGMNQLAITGALFSQYLEQFLEPAVLESCHLTSFSISEVSIDPTLDSFAQEHQVDWIAWVSYSVQAASQEYWIAGSGALGEDGWIMDKTMFVGVTEVGEVYKLSTHGTGP